MKKECRALRHSFFGFKLVRLTIKENKKNTLSSYQPHPQPLSKGRGEWYDLLFWGQMETGFAVLLIFSARLWQLLKVHIVALFFVTDRFKRVSRGVLRKMIIPFVSLYAGFKKFSRGFYSRFFTKFSMVNVGIENNKCLTLWRHNEVGNWLMNVLCLGMLMQCR